MDLLAKFGIKAEYQVVEMLCVYRVLGMQR